MAKIKILAGDQNNLRKKRDEGIEDADKLRQFTALKDQCFLIDKTSLMPNTSIGFNLLKQDGMEIKTIAKADANNPFVITEDFLKRHYKSGYEILIEKASIPAYKDYLNSMVNHVDCSDRNRSNMIVFKEKTKIVIKELLDNPRSGEKMKEAKKAVGTIIELLLDNKASLCTMLSLSRYDYYTYTHCLNVATLSIGLGIELKMGKDEMSILGTGAMMHDIGKSEIPSELLNKQGRLDPMEYLLMQEHVRIGAEILHNSVEFPADGMPAVLQHHEKLNGKGYPRAERGEAIKLFGRICAIADCYDALTTIRSYKDAFIPFEALKIITEQTEAYDKSLLKHFVVMLGRQAESLCP